MIGSGATGCVAPRCPSPAAPGHKLCAVHLEAPAGKRGGWLSAHARQEKRGAGAALDASSVARRLWVGSRPPVDRDLTGYDVLVLCAIEIQPEQLPFHGTIVRCPITDGPLSPAETQLALGAGRTVAKALVDGKTVLSTCHMGLNRSALVAGLGLGLVTRMTADQIVELIRARRGARALGNPHFVTLLRRYVPGHRHRTRAAI